jgi:hypothetical protein
MKTQVSYQFNGLNYVATLNHENWKTFGTVTSRSWTVAPVGHDDITRMLVEVKDQGFRGNDAAGKAAIEAIEKELAA